MVSLPDARKGERLVLITQQANATRAEVLRHARLKGAAELSVPSDIMVVEKVPLLGSGKTDYQAATMLAKERATQVSKTSAASNPDGSTDDPHAEAAE